MQKRIAILASGGGTVAQALLDASADNDLAGGQVVVVISDRGDAGALARARRAGVEALFLDPAHYPDRRSYDHALAAVLDERGIDLICLAGFMRILSPPFVERFRNRVLNTHPALLPAFRGAHAVADALAWGVKTTGATVHFAYEDVDGGPIVLQEAVVVLPDDDEDSLHERIKEVERRLFPEAARLVLAGRIVVRGRRVDVVDTRVPLEVPAEP